MNILHEVMASDNIWCVPTSTLGWHADVALMTGCEAHPTMYRIGLKLRSEYPSGNSAWLRAKVLDNRVKYTSTENMY